MANPNRDEVRVVDLGYAANVRPCLVSSIPAETKDRALVTLVPHTTALRGSRFEVEFNIRFLCKGGFDAQNLVTIPHAKLIRNFGKLTDTLVWECCSGR